MSAVAPRGTHPALLPLLGMRDLLPPAAAARRALGRCLLATLTGHGYELVTTPAIEREAVLELGLATAHGGDPIRFVEPDTGEVAAIRPDMTPQIARIVATRLRDRPPPWRLCYEGSVVRRRHGRARRHRQIAQAGVELIGVEGARGDAEVIGVALATLRGAGLERVHVELGHVGLAGAALAAIADEGARDELAGALGRKDVAELRALGAAAGASRATVARLVLLAGAFGDVGELRRAARRLRDTASATAVAALEEALGLLRSTELGEGVTLGVDLGEVRGQGYYGGISFQLLAPGPGAALGGGGRYDGVLARFGLPPLPATGFAIDLDHLEWALEQAGRAPPSDPAPPRIVVGGPPVPAERLASALRAAGATAATLPASGAAGRAARAALLEYAGAWRFDAAALASERSAQVLLRDDGGHAARRVPATAAAVLDALRAGFGGRFETSGEPAAAVRQARKTRSRA